MLLDNLSNSEILLLLNDNEKAYLKELLYEHPEVFDKIIKSFDVILSDRNIDLHDIPQIILLISNIYNSNLLEKMLEKVDMVNIVQFTIDSILDSGLLQFPGIEISIIKKILNSSISLLLKKEENYCFSLFGGFCPER